MFAKKKFCEIGELKLESKTTLKNVVLAYETFGELNSKKNNAIMIFHALSGDSHVAGRYKSTDKKPGWWDNYVGAGKPIDTNKYFVICANVIGGCQGSTGPGSVDPDTNKPYGINFPFITIDDMVRAQNKLIESLNIDKLLAVIGGSMGGMQALSFVKLYPNKSKLIILIATASHQSAQNIGFHEIGRQAIMSDPGFKKGKPNQGLSIARMIGHITYMSEKSLMEKFGRELQDKENIEFTFKKEFQIESYLHHQGKSFVDRFDANSYLYITRAIDYFDIDLNQILFETKSKFLVLSYKSDWLYTSDDSRKIVKALQQNAKDVSYLDIDSDYGHDSFLVDNKTQKIAIENAIEEAYNEI